MDSFEYQNQSTENVSTKADLATLSLEKRYETTFGPYNGPELRNMSLNESKKGEFKNFSCAYLYL